MQALPLLLAVPILVWLAWTDLRWLRIRNHAVLAMVAIWLVTAPLIGWTEAGWRLLAGLLVLSACVAGFALRVVGGGDAKAVPALMLLIPTGTYAAFALRFSLAMLVGLAVVVALRAVPALRRSGAVSLRARGTFPMGLAIAGAGLLHLAAFA